MTPSEKISLIGENKEFYIALCNRMIDASYNTLDSNGIKFNGTDFNTVPLETLSPSKRDVCLLAIDMNKKYSLLLEKLKEGNFLFLKKEDLDTIGVGLVTMQIMMEREVELKAKAAKEFSEMGKIFLD